MSEQIVIAIITTIGVIIAAFIRSRKKTGQLIPQNHLEIIAGNKANRDYVEGDKTEITYSYQREQKSNFTYLMEKGFTLILTLIFYPLFLGAVGFAWLGGPDGAYAPIGAVVGGILGIIWSITKTGNVKREKGIF